MKYDLIQCSSIIPIKLLIDLLIGKVSDELYISAQITCERG